MTADPAAEPAGAYYDAQYFRLQELARVARGIVDDEIQEAGIYAHQVVSRVKTRESFLRKACKRLLDGTPKYIDPPSQITDLVGVRVVVSIAADVPFMTSQIREAFHVLEDLDRGNETHVDRPGYQSRHLVVRMRPETLETMNQPMLGTDIPIEIQIRSILQDALASFEHDLVYKAERAPSAALRRRLVELASLLQVADRLFSQVRHDALAEAEILDTTPLPMNDPEPSSRWSDSDLEQLIEQVVGQNEADPLPWLRELRTVLEALGYPRAEDFRGLQRRLTGGPLLASRLRQDRPWLTGTQVVDLLLRAELGHQYFDKRSTAADPGQLAADREAFDQQRQKILVGRDEVK